MNHHELPQSKRIFSLNKMVCVILLYIGISTILSNFPIVIAQWSGFIYNAIFNREMMYSLSDIRYIDEVIAPIGFITAVFVLGFLLTFLSAVNIVAQKRREENSIERGPWFGIRLHQEHYIVLFAMSFLALLRNYFFLQDAIASFWGVNVPPMSTIAISSPALIAEALLFCFNLYTALACCYEWERPKPNPEAKKVEMEQYIEQPI
jgi:hypothetical protein